MCFRSRTELESRSRSGRTGTKGLTGCQGPNVGGVTPQNERMQEILRMTQGLDPMQVLRLKQALGEQVNQVRGVPELFG